MNSRQRGFGCSVTCQGWSREQSAAVSSPLPRLSPSQQGPNFVEGLGDMGPGGSFPCDCSRERPQALLANYHSPVTLKTPPGEPESESWGLEVVRQHCAWVNTCKVGHASACA